MTAIYDLQELVHSQRVPKRWPVGCEADTLFYVKVSDAERLLKEIKRLDGACVAAYRAWVQLEGSSQFVKDEASKLLSEIVARTP